MFRRKSLVKLILIYITLSFPCYLSLKCCNCYISNIFSIFKSIFRHYLIQHTIGTSRIGKSSLVLIIRHRALRGEGDVVHHQLLDVLHLLHNPGDCQYEDLLCDNLGHLRRLQSRHKQGHLQTCTGSSSCRPHLVHQATLQPSHHIVQ